MALAAEIKSQLNQYIQLLENDLVIKVNAGEDTVSKEMVELLDELSAMTSKITLEKAALPRTPSFSVNRVGEDTGVIFAGVPLGHEFTSLVLALLQVSGRPPKVDQAVIDQMKGIEGEHHFESYISLSCHNCPDVVQALNMMSVINPNITHTMIDGAAFKDEVESKEIMAVPTVFMNGQPFGSGRMSIEEMIAKMGVSVDADELTSKDHLTCLLLAVVLLVQVQPFMRRAKEFALVLSQSVLAVKCLIRLASRTSLVFHTQKALNLRLASKNM